MTFPKQASTDCDDADAKGHSRSRLLGQGREAESGRSDALLADVGSVASSTKYDSGPYVWYVIFLLAVVNVFNYMDRMALAVLAPSIKADLQLSDAQLGLLVGLAFSLFYAVCGIPIAWWSDRGNRRNIIAIALTVWSAMTALSGAAQNFWHLFAARVGVGAGEAGCLPAAQSMICDYVPLRKRPGAFGFHNFGLIVGMVLGMALAGWLSEGIGWRLAFVALGLPGIALALVVRFTLREPHRGSLDAVEADGASLSFVETIRVLWSCKTYRLLLLFLAVSGFVHYGINQWWPSFYVRVFGLSMSSVGMHLGVAMGVGQGAGLLMGGLLANKASQRDVRLPLTLGAMATALALPVAVGSLLVSSARSSILLAGVTVLLWSVCSAPVIATLYSVVTSRMRATAGALSMFCTAAFGLSLGPFCVGLLSDILTPLFGSEALRYALLAPISFFPVVAVLLYAATKEMPSDLKAAGASEIDRDENCSRPAPTLVRASRPGS